MIILKKVQLNNFLSHKETILEFDDNQSLLIDGRSGSGKSSIVEAIIWCLYGRGRSDNRKLVKSGEKVGRVEIIIFDTESNVYYRIERSISQANKHTISIDSSEDGENFVPLTISGLKEVQTFIEKTLLRASYSLFINSVAYPQDNIESFVRQPAGKRKDLLLEVINAEDYDVYYTRARDLLSLATEKRVRVATQMEGIERIINDSRPLADLLQEKKEKLENLEPLITEKEKELDNIRNSIGLLDQSRKELESEEAALSTFTYQVETYNRQISSIENKISDIKLLDLASINAQLNNLISYQDELKKFEEIQQKIYDRNLKKSSIISDYKNNDYDYETEIRTLNQQLIKLMTDGGLPEKCPQCGHEYKSTQSISSQIKFLEDQIKIKNDLKEKQDLDKANYVAAIESLGPDLTFPEGGLERFNTLKSMVQSVPNLESKKMMILSQQEQLPTYEGELSGLKTKKAEILVNISNSENKIAAIKTKIVSQEQLLPQLNEAEVQLQVADLKTQKNNLLMDIAISTQAKEKLDKSLVEQEEKRTELDSIASEINILSITKEAFSPKGIKAVLIDYLIPRLEDKINEILGELSEFKIRIETQRQAASGDSMVEGLFINIYNELGEEFDFDNYSGGQKLKITVAIAEALATLQKVGFRIFDELFIGLDDESTEDFARVMDKLQKNFKQTICISHLRTIKDLFNDKVMVTKINGTSIIK
jgi:DNA repair protein SbcC/Rad50